MALPPVLVDLVLAPRTPVVSLSPDRRRLLVAEVSPLPPLAELAAEELRLAGLRFNPRNRGPSRGAHFTALRLLDLETGQERTVTGLPPQARWGSIFWSPDAQRLAVTRREDDACRLWLIEVATAEARELLRRPLNGAAGTAFEWHADSRSLLCRCTPDSPGARPERPPQLAPIIQENIGRATPARTFQDLLKDVHDEALFEHFLTSQLVRVDVAGQATELGPPALYTHCESSPDGRLLLVETLRRPFSYLTPAYRFPRRMEVWSNDGTLLHRVADLPLADDVGVAMDAVRRGPRSVHWRSDAPAELVWAEAQDDGDPDRAAEIRDRVYALSLSKASAELQNLPEPRVLADLGWRFAGIYWGHDGLAWLSERWWRTRRERLWELAPGGEGADSSGRAASTPDLLWERSTEDHYGDPGRPLQKPLASGFRAMLLDPPRRQAYLLGPGASPQGNRPFIDAWDLAARKSQRIWQCSGEQYESAVSFLDEGQCQLLTQRETPSEPPNLYIRDLGQPASAPRQVTHFPHPTPQLKDANKELLRYRRADGLECTARLYTPPGYTPAQGPLPLLLWAYPREYKNADAAGQLTDSPYRFIRVSSYSPLLWITQGYAVLEGPTLAIVGEGNAEPNDTYIEQLLAGAQAAVDVVVQRGVADPQRIAVGGHSYGAAMAVSLLAHSRLFCAGVAQSGAYNRTLTPFGFQSEERTLWQAPDAYMRLGPFMHADKIEAPVLLIHGQADENSGTFPLQSERMYQALKGLGKTTRLVLLPHEGHGYEAQESILTVVSETYAWLEKYVKRTGEA